MEASLLNKGDEVLVPTSSHASDPEAVDLVRQHLSLVARMALGLPLK
jgi:hypothetical protein